MNEPSFLCFDCQMRAEMEGNLSTNHNAIFTFVLQTVWCSTYHQLFHISKHTDITLILFCKTLILHKCTNIYKRFFFVGESTYQNSQVSWHVGYHLIYMSIGNWWKVHSSSSPEVQYWSHTRHHRLGYSSWLYLHGYILPHHVQGELTLYILQPKDDSIRCLYILWTNKILTHQCLSLIKSFM